MRAALVLSIYLGVGNIYSPNSPQLARAGDTPMTSVKPKPSPSKECSDSKNNINEEDTCKLTQRSQAKQKAPQSSSSF
jgi:hypothetical protein